MKKHLKLFIEGIVQGVGFRPHVYNLAIAAGISGYVLNDSRGVTIEAEAEEADLLRFKETLLRQPPPLAGIHRVTEEWSSALENYPAFTIKESEETGEKTVLISPDVATCEDCLREMNDPADPRYQYPFINCTNCGPRFTIINDVPYDRKNTSMSDFPMCDYCRGQYEDPMDRRFHAQPVACPHCGPSLLLYDSDGNEIKQDSSSIIRQIADLLRSGKIIAIKGLGGYHLACDAENEEAVKRLRQRKYREDKPFAVMAPDVATVRKYAKMNRAEEDLMTSFRRPIVLLEKISESPLAPSVAPENRYLGVMLPYVPLQHLLLNSFRGLLVMTSGNACEEPICYLDDDVKQRLKKITDYFLINNRAITVRTDDSVTRILQGFEYPLRRSRGYAPFPIIIKHDSPAPVLAVGAEVKNTFCLLRGNQAFVSHHIGDLENLETLESFEKGIEHFKRLFDVTPQIIAYDMHPRYLSTQYAIRQDIEKTIVQHHHAHAASVMADRDLDGDVIGITWDGVGYGADGKLWGCEFMKANFLDFERILHLEYIGLPGGELAVREPWRIALAYLYRTYGEDLFKLPLPLLRRVEEDNLRFVMEMLKRKINTPEISSAGRLFDAAAALIGVRYNATFEGQAAIQMEMMTDDKAEGFYEFEIAGEGSLKIIKPEGIIRGIVEDINKGVTPSVIAGKFHNTAANMILTGARYAGEVTGLRTVTLSGGVFQNMILVRKTLQALEKEPLHIYVHRRVPANDGGLALGQAVIAAHRWRNEIMGVEDKYRLHSTV